MEIQDEVVKKLLDEDEAFRKACKAHKDYENKLEKMEKKSLLSAAEKVEKNRLKKLKLALKDEMEQRISKARAKE